VTADQDVPDDDRMAALAEWAANPWLVQYPHLPEHPDDQADDDPRASLRFLPAPIGEAAADVVAHIRASRLTYEIALADVRLEVLRLLERHADLFRAARLDQRMSWDLLAHRVGVRRHELQVAILPPPPWGSLPGESS
jgi:hypothetical protein